MAVQDRMTPRNLYLYLVCLIMLLVGIFATVQLVRSVVGLAYPDPSSYSFYGGYEEPGMFGGGPDEEQIEQEEDAAKDSERRYEILSMVTAGTTLLLAGGIFALHWRRAQAERSLPAAAPEVPAGPPVP